MDIEHFVPRVADQVPNAREVRVDGVEMGRSVETLMPTLMWVDGADRYREYVPDRMTPMTSPDTYVAGGPSEI